MKIGGLQKLTLLDYPDKLAAVIFTKGCLFRCPFCHNKELVIPKHFLPSTPEKEVIDFLKKRKDQLEAVVISGGEPTIHKDLPFFIKEIKKMGFLIKLDTSGTNPTMLEDLLEKDLLDYIAMDVKSSFEKYKIAAGVNIDLKKIKKSIEIILNSKIDYQFRTTVLDTMHSKEDIISISQSIQGANLYCIQEFRPEKTIDPEFKKASPLKKSILTDIKPIIEKYVKKCIIY